jgi:hypothetical protein
MVNNPFHNISDIIVAAGNGKVHFAARSVEQRSTNEGFSQEEICECISNISKETFKTTVKFENSPVPFDVYLCPFQDDIVYLKLKLTCEGAVVVLASFHKSDYSV